MYALSGGTKEQIIKKYPQVFSEGVGRLESEYHIRLNDQMGPVQHAPRRVPVALREQLKETLEELVQQNIIAPVTLRWPRGVLSHLL